jgi:type II secretory pathway pseudopilin PulG
VDSRRSSSTRRGASLLEALVAILVLTFTFLFWGSGMIVASDAQNKASNHTQAIEMANFMLEEMRGDSNFWSGGEMTGGAAPCTGTAAGNCWRTALNKAPDGSLLPPYDDNTSTPDFSPTNTHPGYCGITAGCLPLVSYRYLWRADIHAAGTSDADQNMADLTVYVIVNVAGRQEIYKVTASRRNPVND